MIVPVRWGTKSYSDVQQFEPSLARTVSAPPPRTSRLDPAHGPGHLACCEGATALRREPAPPNASVVFGNLFRAEERTGDRKPKS